MTVTTTLDRQFFDGDGSNKNFPFNFRFFENSQIYVYLIDVDGNAIGQTLNVDYTLSGAMSPSGGQAVFITAPPVGSDNVLVQRILPVTQPTSIRNQGAFFPALHEDTFDRLTMLIQQASSNIGNSLQLNTAGLSWDFKGRRGINAGDPVNAQDVSTKSYVDTLSARAVRAPTGESLTVLPDAATRALKVLTFDALGNPKATTPESGSAIALENDLANQTDPLKGVAKTGYKGRTAAARLSDHPMLGDYANLAAAKAAAGNKTVEDPNGITYKDAYNQALCVFTEATDAAWAGGRVHRSDSSASHVGVSRVSQAFEMRPFGSGANGPTNADYVASFSNIKKNWFSSTVGGEIDGINITVRQGGRLGGGVQSDCAGALINVGIVDGSGWAACVESQTSTFDPTTAAVVKQVQTAMGVLDSFTGNYYGFTATANAGALSSAYLANLGTGTWANFLQYLGAGNVELFKVDASGRIVIRDGSATTPSKTIRALNGNLNVLNHAQNVQIFTLTDAGASDQPGSAAALAFAAKGAAFNAGASAIVYGGTTAATATAGGGQATPGTVLAYINVNVQGTPAKIPVYAA